jgi:hypothetical protein
MYDLKYTSSFEVYKRFHDLMDFTPTTSLSKRPHLAKTLSKFINPR